MVKLQSQEEARFLESTGTLEAHFANGQLVVIIYPEQKSYVRTPDQINMLMEALYIVFGVPSNW